MSSTIETVNQWGGQFLAFAWPMFWQSSLLVLFVFALDLILARKVRAAIRYGLWLTVLLKLVLPPTLALPTGAVWWLFPEKPAFELPAAPKYIVTSDTSVPLPDFVPDIPLPAPKPRLDGAGWALLASITVSAGLLLWLVVCWRQVASQIQNAAASEESAGALAAAQQMAGLRSRARLKIVDGRMSPAACGLFHPIILLPRMLAENLPAGQLNAVLLHELFHLRRKDVWVNCAQALLQIFYWWHPLLWIANARIRRVREEAVDDAVMLALRDGRDIYAPTLLEVAKLAFRSPLMSLGLVGIMESRSALRQRIERLVNFRAPGKAGLTFLSLCGIFTFSAVALPMGQAPEKTNAGAVLLQTGDNSAVVTNTIDTSTRTATFGIRRSMNENVLGKVLLDAGVKIPPTVLYMDGGVLLVRGSREQLALVNEAV
ncbi:MAG TPA: M56 family metallopeptidase, partial [Verrucomicrobiae bacterium]|nr:M56 family metallopeptidase [Verrucomicrobiae bacterium]